jgi:hypothetical protein
VSHAENETAKPAGLPRGGRAADPGGLEALVRDLEGPGASDQTLRNRVQQAEVDGQSGGDAEREAAIWWRTGVMVWNLSASAYFARKDDSAVALPVHRCEVRATFEGPN